MSEHHQIISKKGHSDENRLLYVEQRLVAGIGRPPGMGDEDGAPNTPPYPMGDPLLNPGTTGQLGFKDFEPPPMEPRGNRRTSDEEDDGERSKSRPIGTPNESPGYQQDAPNGPQGYQQDAPNWPPRDAPNGSPGYPQDMQHQGPIGYPQDAPNGPPRFPPGYQQDVPNGPPGYAPRPEYKSKSYGHEKPKKGFFKRLFSRKKKK